MDSKEHILTIIGLFASWLLVYLIIWIIGKIQYFSLYPERLFKGKSKNRGEKMKNKNELDLIYKTFNHLSLSELEEAFSNADTQEKKDFFLKLYNLKLAENQMKVIQGDFIL